MTGISFRQQARVCCIVSLSKFWLQREVIFSFIHSLANGDILWVCYQSNYEERADFRSCRKFCFSLEAAQLIMVEKKTNFARIVQYPFWLYLQHKIYILWIHYNFSKKKKKKKGNIVSHGYMLLDVSIYFEMVVFPSC